MHSVSRLAPSLKHVMLHDMPLYGVLPFFAQLVLHLLLCNTADSCQGDSIGCQVVGRVTLLLLHLARMAASRPALLARFTLFTIGRSIAADV